jgi:cytoskeleton-associated protein 5
MEAAFLTGKEAVCRAAQLDHPDPEVKFNLMVDASECTLHWDGSPAENGGGVEAIVLLQQEILTNEGVLFCFDRELWAVLSGICHFRHLPEGQQFHVLTDHEPLTAACTGYQGLGQPNSSDSWPTWQSIRQTSGT